MKTEDKKIYYNKENYPFFSRKDASKSNLILNLRRLRKEHKIKTSIDNVNKKQDSLTELAIQFAIEIFIADIISDYSQVVEELLHEYYKDMGEEVKIKKEV